MSFLLTCDSLWKSRRMVAVYFAMLRWRTEQGVAMSNRKKGPWKDCAQSCRWRWREKMLQPVSGLLDLLMANIGPNGCMHTHRNIWAQAFE